ncbi:MAG TPA: hypothetical protein VLU94_02025, partial [Candidatus Nitrosotalea sp.]|nr:hypothetical protein [Candidatus Nitrosotalea sp.]
NSGNFGADRIDPYESFVNSGEIDAFDLQIRSKNLDNGGTLVSSAGVTIDTTQGKVDGGSIFAGGGIAVSGTAIKFRNSTLNPAEKLTLSLTDTLQDSGLDGPNTWTPGDGLAITVKPKVSDLFGTTVVLSTPRFANVINVSAADDLGPTVAGYSNNLAIGHLSLETGIDGLLTFTGTGLNNALYVDFLEVGPSVLADLEGTLEIAPNMVIYFANANVSVDQLDGQLGGHLVWAKDFAGPNSSVDVLLLNGQTVKMNSALRASTTIDTDGDGVANAFDLYPLDAAAWNSSQGPSGNAKVTLTNSGSSQSVAVSWKALPSDNYRVEYTASLSPPNWQPLTGYTNLVVTNGAINVLDADLPVGQSQRFYRLRPAGGSGGNGP